MNEPAFPQPKESARVFEGLSIRDYFAAQALNSLVKEALKLDHKSWEATAQHAYFIADAMLEARKQ